MNKKATPTIVFGSTHPANNIPPGGTPLSALAQHLMFMGTTGSGKSLLTAQLIQQLLRKKETSARDATKAPATFARLRNLLDTV